MIAGPGGVELIYDIKAEGKSENQKWAFRGKEKETGGGARKKRDGEHQTSR